MPWSVAEGRLEADQKDAGGWKQTGGGPMWRRDIRVLGWIVYVMACGAVNTFNLKVTSALYLSHILPIRGRGVEGVEKFNTRVVGGFLRVQFSTFTSSSRLIVRLNK